MNGSTIEHFLELAPTLAERYTRDEGGELPRRYTFNTIKNRLLNAISGDSGMPRVLMLTGLRGVGKTTLLFQLYKELIKNDWNTQRIVYLTMDKAMFAGKGILDLFREYQDRVVYDYLAKLPDKFIFLIDEVHYSPKWDLEVKIIHDEAPNAFFVLSGSSALHLEMSADLARRSFSQRLHPLNYLEHLALGARKEIDFGIADEYRKSLFQSGSAEEIVNSYPGSVRELRKVLRKFGGYSPGSLQKYILEGGMPWSNKGNTESRRLYDVVERIIVKDIPQVGGHDSRTLRAIPSLLGMIAPAPDTSLNTIARDLDGVSIASVRRILDTLTKCGLIIEVQPHGGMKRSLRGETRKYFASPCLAAAVIEIAGFDPRKFISPLTECAVCSNLQRLVEESNGAGLSYCRGKGHADFVFENKEGKIVIEVGSGKKEHGTAQVKRSLRETKAKIGLLAAECDDIEQNNNVVKIPLKEFLCI